MINQESSVLVSHKGDLLSLYTSLSFLFFPGNVACETDRSYQVPRFGITDKKVSLHVGVHYYVDKELMANSQAACGRACQIESE